MHGLLVFSRLGVLPALRGRIPTRTRADTACGEYLQRRSPGTLIDLFTSSVYGGGDPVVREGEQSEGLHVVLSGAVRVSKVEDSDALTLAELGPGQVFGEISLIQQNPAMATVSAIGKGGISDSAPTASG